MLAAVATAMLVLAGCGGDSEEPADPAGQVSQEGGLQERVREAAAPDESIFPASQGKTLEQLAAEVRGGGATEVGLASSVFTTGGEDRLAFGVIDDEGQFVYGQTAVYAAPTPQEPAIGPFLAPADVLVTQGRYRSKQAATEADPFAAVYQAHIPFDRKGPWSILTVTREGNTWLAAPSQIEVTTPKADQIPDVGEPAPKVATDTMETAKGNVENIDTRVPPSDMHASSLEDVRRHEARGAAVRDAAALPVAGLRAGRRRRAAAAREVRRPGGVHPPGGLQRERPQAGPARPAQRL